MILTSMDTNKARTPTKHFFHLYVDDTIIIIQSSSIPEVLTNGLEQQLEELGSWFYRNKLSVNISKKEVIFFEKSNKVEQCKKRNMNLVSKRKTRI